MTTGRVDKLRQRCQEMLAPGEEILLEAEATVKLGYLSDFGTGRAYLTGRRVLWIRRDTPLVRPLLFWIPDAVIIEVSSMDGVRMIRSVSRAWLRIQTAGKTYHIRLGKGPYPTLRDNPRTTEEWLHAIETARSKYPRPAAEGPPPRPPGDTKLAGKLFILLNTLGLPFWLAGFVLMESPVEFYLIMGGVTVAGVGVGFLLTRIS